jgi:xanthosine utilization system XapX-like protein
LSPIGTTQRVTLTAVAGLWFGVVASLAALSVFSAAGVGTPAIGTALVVPIVLALWAVPRSSALREIALGTPLTALVALHAGRLLGFFFLLLVAAGRLPPTFANIAGWGDIIVAITALPLAWAIHQRVNRW